MHTSPTIADMRAVVRRARAAGQRIALVPTMGALHDGHLTLVDAARRHADYVVVSIFVNPLQFGPSEDLAKYPRTLEADVAALAARGADAVFTPAAAEMYAAGRMITVTAAPHDATYEGAVRPDHFTGVLTVVTKLFNIVQPDVAVFGQKDLQQLSFVRRLVRELDFPIEIVAAPTVREPDGLARSSRNRYLSDDERARAARISAALRAVADAYAQGTRRAEQLRSVGERVLADDRAMTVDYFDLVDPDSFAPIAQAEPGTGVIVAARVGTTRLLDNIIL